MTPHEFESALRTAFGIAKRPFSGYGLHNKAEAVHNVLHACGMFVSRAEPLQDSDPDEDSYQVYGRGFKFDKDRGDFISWPNAWPKPVALMQFIHEQNDRNICGRCQIWKERTGIMILPVVGSIFTERNAIALCTKCIGGWRQSPPKMAFIGQLDIRHGWCSSDGRSGHNLKKTLGVDDLHKDHACINLIPRDAHPVSCMPEKVFLRLHALGIDPFLHQCSAPVVALGQKAAIGLADGPPVDELHGFKIITRKGRRILCLPHPSGRSNLWHSEQHRIQLALNEYAQQQ